MVMLCLYYHTLLWVSQGRKLSSQLNKNKWGLLRFYYCQIQDIDMKLKPREAQKPIFSEYFRSALTSSIDINFKTTV